MIDHLKTNTNNGLETYLNVGTFLMRRMALNTYIICYIN